MNRFAADGAWGDGVTSAATGYCVVYATEIALLFVTLIALGPLVRTLAQNQREPDKLELAEFPT